MNQTASDRIRKLAKKKNALILAHNYQPPQIQDIADMCGDSLELSIKAANTDAEILVFCGVHFMAETASILCPEKTVLLPRTDAGCPMANMVTPRELIARIETMPGVPVVTYVNSSAAVKALSTVCCTSANAVEVVKNLEAAEILMVPDRNLAAYTAAHTGKTVHCWDGFCPYHDRLDRQTALNARKGHPSAVFMAHPECRPEVTEIADIVTSTSGMLDCAARSRHSEFIVGTETGLIYPLQKQNPEKSFYPASERMYCSDMKKITLADVEASLENLSGEVRVSEDIRAPALSAVKKMLTV